MSRKKDLRTICFKKNILKFPEGSCLVTMGETIVLVTATVEEKVPPFLEGKGIGWVTAEYAMLPRSNKTRKKREIYVGKPDARGQEIQRLIGRTLRTCIDREKLGERTITIDCDVLQGDGGTRTASINGGFVALHGACQHLLKKGLIQENPLRFFIGAVSVGKVHGEYILDLCYAEDSNADVDMNIVLNENGDFVEIQGTGEEGVFNQKDFDAILALGQLGIAEIIAKMKETCNEDSVGNHQ